MSTEDGPGASWEHARAYANLLGAMPSSFITTIRQLKADGDKGGPLSRTTIFQTGRLCASPSLSGTLIAGSKSIFPELNVTDSASLVELVPASALAAMIGIAFYYKKAKKLALPEEWAHYTRTVHNRNLLGSSIGKYIEPIGVTRGLLMGTMDTIAVTCFHLHDKKGFTDYRRSLKNKNKAEDLSFELDRWGCNRYHVAAILIQSVGFGVDFSNAFATGLTSSDENEEKYLTGDSLRLRFGKIWLESLEKTGKQPDRAIRVDFFPEKSGIDALESLAKKINATPLTTSWLDAVKEEIDIPEDGSEEE